MARNESTTNRPAAEAGKFAPAAGLATRQAGAFCVPDGWWVFEARAIDGRAVRWVAPAVSGGRPLVRWLGAYGKGPSLAAALDWELGPVSRARSAAIPRDGCGPLGGVGLLLDPARAHLARAVPRDCWSDVVAGAYIPTRYNRLQTRSWRAAFAWAQRTKAEECGYVEAIVGFDSRAVVAIVTAMRDVPPEVTATGLPVVEWADLAPEAPQRAETEGGKRPPIGNLAWVVAIRGRDYRKVGVWFPGWWSWNVPVEVYTLGEACCDTARASSVRAMRRLIRHSLRMGAFRGDDIGVWPVRMTDGEVRWLLSQMCPPEWWKSIERQTDGISDATSAAKYAAHALAALAKRQARVSQAEGGVL